MVILLKVVEVLELRVVIVLMIVIVIRVVIRLYLMVVVFDLFFKNVCIGNFYYVGYRSFELFLGLFWNEFGFMVIC